MSLIELAITVLSVVLLRRWMASSPMFSTRVSAMVIARLATTVMPFEVLRTVIPASTTFDAFSIRTPLPRAGTAPRPAPPYEDRRPRSGRMRCRWW